MNILIQLAYLLASILFIVGIKMLGKTKDARRGNLYSALAMFVAILATLAQVEMISLVDIFICILIGSAIGAFIANRVEMTQMPEMVALFNGFGGLASLSVVFADYWLNTQIYSYSLDSITGTSVALGIFIGGITFTGSMIAFLKLNGRISGNAITFSGQHLLNLVLFLATIVFAVVGMLDQAEPMYLYILIGLSFVRYFDGNPYRWS